MWIKRAIVLVVSGIVLIVMQAITNQLLLVGGFNPRPSVIIVYNVFPFLVGVGVGLMLGRRPKWKFSAPAFTLLFLPSLLFMLTAFVPNPLLGLNSTLYASHYVQILT